MLNYGKIDIQYKVGGTKNMDRLYQIMSLVGIGLCLLVVVGCIVGVILEAIGYWD